MPPRKESTFVGELSADYPIPPGFEQYFGDERPLGLYKDLTDAFQKEIPEVRHFIHLQLPEVYDENEISLQTDLFLIEVEEDGEARRAVVAVARHGKELVTPAPDGLSKHIGGFGAYPTKNGRSPVEYAIAHSCDLARKMTEKNDFAGLLEIDLAEIGLGFLDHDLKPGFPGGKATLIAADDPRKTDWMHSLILQRVTGVLFSENGPIPNMITGTDVGEGQKILETMSKGSALFGEARVAGIKEGFIPLSKFVKHSMLAAYENLRELYGEEISEIEGSHVVVQGFGNVGFPTAQAMLEKGAACVYVADPVLTDECEYTPERKRELVNNFDQLKAEYGDRIQLVGVNEIYDKKIAIFCPCAGEGFITAEVMGKLKENDVKVILPAANMPSGKGEEAREVGILAHKNGIYYIPEVISNYGVVAAGVFEYLLRKALEIKPDFDVEDFINSVLPRYIETNVKKQMEHLKQISKEKGVVLYNAAEIAYKEHLETLRLSA